MYTITRVGHVSFNSTVTDVTLRSLQLRVPRTPSPYPGVVPSPWHSLGTELVNPATAREAIEAAGLDYTVHKKPMDAIVKMWARENDYATVRTDTADVLGIVGESYEPIQNRDAFRFFDTLVSTDEAMYETAGMIGRGERIWILAKLPGHIKVQGTDLVSKYLLLTNSHNGSSLVRVKIMPIRLVCNNTLTVEPPGTGEVHIRHSSDAAGDKEQALSLLRLSNSVYEHVDAIFNRMAITKISDKQLQAYVTTLVPDSEGEDNAAIRGIRNTILELYECGEGADFSRGTIWAAYNCVTEYTDHAVYIQPITRLESIWFGRGEQLKLKAFQLAEDMM